MLQKQFKWERFERKEEERRGNPINEIVSSEDYFSIEKTSLVLKRLY